MKNENHLAIDVGNTHIKFGYFENHQLKSSGICTDWTENQWVTFYNENPFSTILIGSVGASTKQLLAKLPKQCAVHIIDESTNYPFSTSYDNLQQLGVDRRAAISGAVAHYHKTPLLIIDAGSCITYDYVSAEGHHHGGAISPGRNMRYQAMHLFTDKLPQLQPSDQIPKLGTSTKTSMELGVEFGFVAEIQAQVESFFEEYGNFTIILTGGDADFLKKKIKNTIFVDADLTLKGLYHLLMFNNFHEK